MLQIVDTLKGGTKKLTDSHFMCANKQLLEVPISKLRENMNELMSAMPTIVIIGTFIGVGFIILYAGKDKKRDETSQ